MSRIVVYHGSYGCDTGCCGHYVELLGSDADRREFGFNHPNGESTIEFAKRVVTEQFGADHVADIDWGASVIVDGDNC